MSERISFKRPPGVLRLMPQASPKRLRVGIIALQQIRPETTVFVENFAPSGLLLPLRRNRDLANIGSRFCHFMLWDRSIRAETSTETRHRAGAKAVASAQTSDCSWHPGAGG